MATVTPPRQTHFDRAAVNRRVRHPLQTIRGYIRRYVLWEGSAVTILFLAVCFWAGLAVDYLPWRIFSFDWLWETNESAGTAASFGLRLTVLTVLALALIAVVVFKVVRRLFREFNDAAVALLLERRYPKELGDRLITAVELADPELSSKYGYSQAMVDHTIQDAVVRVEKLPVQEIFRWGRLRLLLLLAVVATLGVYVLVGIGYSAFTASSPMTFFHRFNQTATIWAERNLLMESSYWPPNTLLELVRFPNSGDLRVPRDEARPDVIVRCVTWAIAAAPDKDKAPRGWRALRLEDLRDLLPNEYANLSLPDDWTGWTVDLDDLDPKVHNGVIPAGWQWQGKTSGYLRQQLARDKVKEDLERNAGGPFARDEIHHMLRWRNWTADRLEQQLAKSDDGVASGVAALAAMVDQRAWQVAFRLQSEHPQALAAFQTLLQKLEELANDPRMGRTLRKMRTPSEEGEVVANRKMEDDNRGTTVCKKAGNGKWLFPLGDLKQSCSFFVKAGDNATPTRQITLVPPPELERLIYDKEEPAYQYYRLLDNPDFLKDKRQHTRAVSVSLNGTVSRIYLPWGSSLKITADIDRAVKTAAITDVKKFEESTSEKPDRPEISASKDGRIIPLAREGVFKDAGGNVAVSRIHIDLGKVTKKLEFQLEFLDGEFVKGSRHIMVVPQEDDAPRVSNGPKLATAPRLVTLSDTTVTSVLGEKCYLITPDAFLKLRGIIEDDRGLAKIQYSVEVQELPIQQFNQKDAPAETPAQPETTPEKKGSTRDGEAFAAGLQFMPGPTGYAYGYFAATYYAAMKEAYLFLEPHTKYSAKAQVALGRAKLELNRPDESDVSPAEIERLLHIPPSHRPLLLEAMSLKQDDAVGVKKFTDRLKAANLTEGFLREVMGYMGLAADGRNKVEQMMLTDPGAALFQLLQPLTADAKVREANKKLLVKQPESTLVLKYDLRTEDALMNGFDLLFLRHDLGLEDVKQLTELDVQNLQDAKPWSKAQRRWRFLKAFGDSRGHYHLGLKLTIEITDNNIVTGPGKKTTVLPYSFVIISENELLALMVAEQRTHYDTLVRMVDKLEEKKTALMSRLEDYQRAGDPFFLVGPLDKAKQELLESSTTAKQVRESFEEMLKEMELNRMKKDRIAKVRDKIIAPLRTVTAPETGAFARSQSWIQLTIKAVEPDADKWLKNGVQVNDDTPVKKEIDARRPEHVKNTKRVVDDMKALIDELRDMLLVMRSVVSENEAIEHLVEAERLQRQVDQVLKLFQRQFTEWLLLGSAKTP